LAAGLRDAITDVREILKPLIREYETAFLSVARQQLFDDALLELKLKRLTEKADLPPDAALLPESLMTSTGVGQLILGKERFPQLNAILRDFNGDKFKDESEIDRLYHVVKDRLEKNAGVRRSSQSSSTAKSG
jgi:hypothetical protein